jgi:hypothetical protein
MCARCQINAAHDEIAAEQRRGPAIHENAPIRIKPVIEQQYCGRVGICAEYNVFGRVIFEFNRAGISVGWVHLWLN